MSSIQIMACRAKPLFAPSHYLNQCWNIVNLTLWNKLQFNVNQNSYTFIQENAFENVVWKMATILSRPQCVKIFDGTQPRVGWEVKISWTWTNRALWYFTTDLFNRKCSTSPQTNFTGSAQDINLSLKKNYFCKINSTFPRSQWVNLHII